MDIFESLENLNVSEECFEDIAGLVEEYLNETSDKKAQRVLDAALQRYNRDSYLAGIKLLQGDKSGEAEGEAAQDKYIKHIQLQQKRAKRLGKKLVQDSQDHDKFTIEESNNNPQKRTFEQAYAELKQNREKKKKELMNILNNGLKRTEEMATQINGNGQELRNKKF